MMAEGHKNEQSAFSSPYLTTHLTISAEVSVIVGGLWEDLSEEKKAIFRHQDIQDAGNVTLVTQLLQLATILDNVGLHAEYLCVEL